MLPYCFLSKKKKKTGGKFSRRLFDYKEKSLVESKRFVRTEHPMVIQIPTDDLHGLSVLYTTSKDGNWVIVPTVSLPLPPLQMPHIFLPLPFSDVCPTILLGENGMQFMRNSKNLQKFAYEYTTCFLDKVQKKASMFHSLRFPPRNGVAAEKN